MGVPLEEHQSGFEIGGDCLGSPVTIFCPVVVSLAVPQLFWHHRLVSWKTVFPRTAQGDLFEDG